jgi:hypothetical protein
MDVLEILKSNQVRDWVQRLRARDPLPPLAPGAEWDGALSRAINDTSIEKIFAGVPHFEEAMALAVKSGLLLWNDALEPSHVLSQAVTTTTGSYWHGIMHRREPDFGNSKYWFHRVGKHPVFTLVMEEAAAFLKTLQGEYAEGWLSEIQAKGWDPFQFVDRCELAVRGKEPKEVVTVLERVQVIEIETLLAWTAQQAGT